MYSFAKGLGRGLTLLLLWLAPLTHLWSTGGHRRHGLSQFFAFPFGRPFTELRYFGNDKPALRLWEVGFLQVVEMRRNNIFFAVNEALVGCVFRGFVDLVDESCDSGFGVFLLCFVELREHKYNAKEEWIERTFVNIRCD